MTETKFRVWDTHLNMFFKPTYEAYAGKLQDLSITLCGRLLRRTLEKPAEDESMFEGRYILTQYTGLKDMYGEELYHKDIVHHSWMEDFLEPFLNVIEEENGAYGYHSQVGFISYCQNKAFEFTKGQSPFIKKVGNIYQNPELLPNA